MSVITNVPEPNLWEEICKEFAQKRPPFETIDDEDKLSVDTDYDNFDPSKHTPIFYGKMFANVATDDNILSDFDPATSHPACIGHSFTTKPPMPPGTPPPLPPNRKNCSHTEYLNHYVFPWLLPAIQAMLKQAKIEKCFEGDLPEGEDERRRTKFNACDFITEHLFRHNPYHDDTRKDTSLADIPFVKDWLKDHPRPPLPMSLIWTDEEAALIIQSFWRGYLVRREPDVQELRIWQREWREENRGIQHRVSEFWEKQMPGGDEPTPNVSESRLDALKDNDSLHVKSPVPS